MQIKLKDNWNEISILEFQLIMQILSNTEFTDNDKIQKLIPILTNIPANKVDKVLQADYIILKAHLLEFCYNMPTEIKLPHILEINGIKYGIKPDLFSQTNEEFRLTEDLRKDGLFIDNIHTILAIYYRPLISKGNILHIVIDKLKRKIKKKTNFQLNTELNKYNNYSIEEFNKHTVTDRANLFRQYLTADIILSFKTFFLISSVNYIEYMKTFMMKQSTPQMKKTQMTHLKIDGDI